MIERLFLSHPRSVGESYGEHLATATRFGWAMICGGFACIIHALVPALFSNRASNCVKSLYAQMKARQPHLARRQAAFEQPEWQLEYEI